MRNATAYNRQESAAEEPIKTPSNASRLPRKSPESGRLPVANVGLIYYETENYEKRLLAFEQALEMEEGRRHATLLMPKFKGK